MAIEDRVRQEIEEFHRFFQDWLGGTLPNTDEAYARLGDSLADGFLLVTPNANEIDRAGAVGHIRGQHGSRPGLRMSVGGVRIVAQEGPVVVVRYEGHEEGHGEPNHRLCTVVLREAGGTPNGFQWLSAQETWMR